MRDLYIISLESYIRALALTSNEVYNIERSSLNVVSSTKRSRY